MFDKKEFFLKPKIKFIPWTVLFCFLLLSLFFGCKEKKKINGPVYGTASVVLVPEYHFAIHTLYNPARLIEIYQPLMDYLEKHVRNAHFTLEASRDYISFENKYKEAGPEFILPNPWQAIQAMQSGYDVIVMAGEPDDFKGVFIVRKDGEINKPADLKGKTVCYPSATALAACIMPQYFLHQKGIDVNKDIKNIYVGSQESSIMNVYLKNSAVAATWTVPWRSFQKEHPEKASELKLIWETESLINNPVMIRRNIDSSIRKQVTECLIHMPENEEGRVILSEMQTARFLPATNKDYEVVRQYVKQFEKEVRKIEIR